MQVSDSHKFMFFHIRKTAGTSIAVAIGKVSKDPFKDRHLRPSRAKQWMPRKFPRYFKFSFIRNPWDRIVSCYEYDAQNTREFMNGGHHYRMSFPDYLHLRLCKTGGWWTECQRDFLAVQGHLLVDFVGRFENLQQDYNKICDRVGLKAQKLPERRMTKRKPYREYFNNETKKLVGDIFAVDLETFGYKFEEG